MPTVKLNETIQQITKILHLLGLWQKEGQSTYRETGRKLINTFHIILYQIFIVTHAFLSETKNELVFLIEVAIIILVIAIKLCYIGWKQEEILAFLYDPIIVHSTADDETVDHVHKKIKIFTNFVRSYLVMLCVALAAETFLFLPVFSNERMLPLFISFTSVGKYSEIVYWLEYAFILSGIFSTIVCSFTINVIVWYTMLNYSLAYRVLGSQMRNLGVNKMNKRNSQQVTKQLFHQNCVEIIKSHQNIYWYYQCSHQYYIQQQDNNIFVIFYYRTIEKFKSFFSKLFLAQITTSSVTICISGYVLAHSSQDELAETPIFFITLLYAVFEIFAVMYLANDISLASDQLSYCLFQSNWLDLPKACIRYILIMGEFLRKPHRLLIWKIYPMNLESLVSILKGAYSMFNVLEKFK